MLYINAIYSIACVCIHIYTIYHTMHRLRHRAPAVVTAAKLDTAQPAACQQLSPYNPSFEAARSPSHAAQLLRQGKHCQHVLRTAGRAATLGTGLPCQSAINVRVTVSSGYGVRGTGPEPPLTRRGQQRPRRAAPSVARGPRPAPLLQGRACAAMARGGTAAWLRAAAAAGAGAGACRHGDRGGGAARGRRAARQA